MEAYEHQDVAFEQLVDYLNVSRDLNRNPVFQVLFTFEPQGEEEAFKLDDINIEPHEASYPISKFDLSLHVFEQEEELEVVIEYAKDLFEKGTIERLGEHFKELTARLLQKPDDPIAQLPLLTSQEEHQLLIEWNDTEKEYPKDQTIHQLFEDTSS